MVIVEVKIISVVVIVLLEVGRSEVIVVRIVLAKVGLVIAMTIIVTL